MSDQDKRHLWNGKEPSYYVTGHAPQAAIEAALPDVLEDGTLHQDGYFTWNAKKHRLYERPSQLPCKFWLAAPEPAALPDVPTVPEDEHSAFVLWLSTNYPHAWDLDAAEHAWKHEHVSALAWKARAMLSAAPEPEPEPDYSSGDWSHVGELPAEPAQAEQPRNEPVAHCAMALDGKSIAFFDGKPMVMVGKVGNECHPTPLYTSPQAQPMSDEQICKLAIQVQYGISPHADTLAFARAVERFHKIGG